MDNDERAEQTRAAIDATRASNRLRPEVNAAVMAKVNELESLRESKTGPALWIEEARISNEINAILGDVDSTPIPEYATELARNLKGDRAAQDEARLHDDQRRERIDEANRAFGVVPEIDLVRSVDTPNTFATFEPLAQVREASTATLAWALQTGPPMLMLAGTPGNGKTHLCEAAALYKQAQGHGVVYTTESDMMAAIREATPAHDVVINAYATVAHLIIDDLGREALSPAMGAALDRIIDSRWKYAGGVYTMATTNLLGTDFRKKGLARIASRFGDVSRSRAITIEAGDYRKRKRD